MTKVLSSLSQKSSSSIPLACQGYVEMVSAYSFFSSDKVTFDSVLEGHIEKTQERLSLQDTVALVGDTTEIEKKRTKQNMEGIGYLDRVRRGIRLFYSPLTRLKTEC